MPRESIVRHQMGGTGKTRIISAKGHLDHIEQAIRYLAVPDETLCSFIDGHADRSGIVDSCYD